MKYFILGMLFSLRSFSAEVHSKVEVNHTSEKELVFKLIPKEGLVINKEGPWKLSIAETSGINFAEKTLDKSKFDDKQGVFKMSVKSWTSSPASLQYKMIAFVCTADKAKCFRDVLEAKIDVRK